MRVVFCDIDGTLLRNDKSLSDNNRYALKKLVEQGDRFVLVTGRCPDALYPLLEDLAIEPEPDCIYCSGTYMERGRRAVFSTGFSHAQAEEILAFLEEKRLSYSIYSEKLWISPRRDENLELEERLVRAKSAIGTLADIPKDAPITKFLVMSTDEAVKGVRRMLKERFPQYEFLSGMGYLIDVTKGDIDKGRACEKYCELYGIDIHKALCFGDGYNDESMLRAVGNAYVMANAEADLKAHFPNHALSNEEDGVYHKLMELGWID